MTPEELADQIATQEGKLKKPLATVKPTAGPRLADPNVAAAFAALRARSRQRGYDVQLGSGDRSEEEQAGIYYAPGNVQIGPHTRRQAKNGLPVAEPGHSNHNKNTAADIKVFDARGRRVPPSTVYADAEATGWKPLKGDPPHLNYAGQAIPASFSPEQLADQVARTEGRLKSPEELADEIAHTEARSRPSGTPGTGLTPAAAERAGGIPVLPPVPGAGAAPGFRPATAAMARGELYGPVREQSGPPRPGTQAIPPERVYGGSPNYHVYNPFENRPIQPHPWNERLGREIQRFTTGTFADKTQDRRRADQAAGKEPLDPVLSRNPQVQARQQREADEIHSVYQMMIGLRNAKGNYTPPTVAETASFAKSRGPAATPFQKAVLQSLVSAARYRAGSTELQDAAVTGGISAAAAAGGGLLVKGGGAVLGRFAPGVVEGAGNLIARAGRAAPLAQGIATGMAHGAAFGGLQAPALRKYENPQATIGDLLEATGQGVGGGAAAGGVLGGAAPLLGLTLGGLGAGVQKRVVGLLRQREALLASRGEQAGAPLARLEQALTAELRQAHTTPAQPRPDTHLPVDRHLTTGKFVAAGKGAPAPRVPTLDTPAGPVRLTPGVEVEVPNLSSNARFKVDHVDARGVVHLTAPNGRKAQVLKRELRVPEPAPTVEEVTVTPGISAEKLTPGPETRPTLTPVTEARAKKVNGAPQAPAPRAKATAITPEGRIHVKGTVAPLSSDATDDLIHALNLREGVEDPASREWGQTAPAKRTDAAFLALEKPGVLDAARQLRTQREAHLGRGLAAENRGLERQGVAGRPLVQEAHHYGDPITHREGGKVYRYRGLQEEYQTPEQLRALYRAVKTPARDSRLYPTPAGGMSLRDLIFDGKMLPDEVATRSGSSFASPERPLTELAQGGSQAKRPYSPPVAARIAPDPIPGGDRKRLTNIIFDLEKTTGKKISVGKASPRATGTYYPGSAKTVIRHAGNLDVTAHEVAHSLDDRFSLVGQWSGARQRSPYDAELIPHFSAHGSNGTTLAYRRAEGVAEWMRAWMVNPAAAEKAAPGFAAHFKASVPEATRTALRSFGDDIRRHAGLPAEQRTLANVRMTPDSKLPLRQQAQEAIHGTGAGFQTTGLDRLKAKVLDDLGPVMKGIHAARELRGVNPLPSDDPELLIRLHAGVNGKIQNVMEHGPVDVGGKRVAGFDGGFARLYEPLDNTSAATLKADQDSVVAYMIAQRTKRQAGRITATGGDPARAQITGAGAGLESDLAQAQKVLADHAARPAAERTRIEEGAKRYRQWSDQLLTYLEESGRYSKQQVADIRASNPDYVSFSRVMDDLGDSTRPPAGRGGKLGSAAQVVQRIRGSSRAIENPYVSLMEQTGRVIQEADRNVALRKFRDLLTTSRSMYQGKPLDLSAIGKRVPLGEQGNAVTIYVDGKAERWKFEDGIHQALTGWGEVPDGDLLTALAGFTRSAITHAPGFAVRNTIRDTLERVVTSPVNSTLGDLGAGVRGAGRNELETAGGSQTGHYLQDRIGFHGEQAKIIRKLARDRNTLIVRAEDLGRVVSDLGKKSEEINRLAEYQAALRHAKEKLGYSDRDAQLYAAGKARELMDFAQAGTLLRKINRYVPFTNAQVQGMRRMVRLARENPAQFAGKWAGYVVAPTLAMWGYNQATGAIKEYRQLPAYQRDLFFNFKVGDCWVTIPKGFELAVMAAGVERTLDRAAGNKRAFEGYAGTVAKAISPIQDVPILGGLEPFVEAGYNHDRFRDRTIVPENEAGRALELRPGTKDASRVGQALQVVTRQDARSIDHVIRGLTGGTGDLVLRASDLGRKDRPDALRSTGEAIVGLTKRPPLYNARDVEYDQRRAKELNRENDPRLKNLQRMLRAAADAQGADKARKEKAARDFATRLRASLEQAQGRQPRPRR